MKIASVADVKSRLSAYLKEIEQDPVIITRNGKAVAVLLAVADEDEFGTAGAGPFAQVPGDPRQVATPDRRDGRHSPRRVLAPGGSGEPRAGRQGEPGATPHQAGHLTAASRR